MDGLPIGSGSHLGNLEARIQNPLQENGVDGGAEGNSQPTVDGTAQTAVVGPPGGLRETVCGRRGSCLRRLPVTREVEGSSLFRKRDRSEFESLSSLVRLIQRIVGHGTDNH